MEDHVPTEFEVGLRRRLTELTTLRTSRIIHTEEGRHLVAHLVRILETILDGNPATELPVRNHP